MSGEKGGWVDDLDAWSRSADGDEAWEAALAEAYRWAAEARLYQCPRGCCVEHLHPTIEGGSGWGPVDCPHRGDEPDTIRATWVEVAR